MKTGIREVDVASSRKISVHPLWVVASFFAPSFFALAFGLSAFSVSAQETGTIRGVVAEEDSWRLIESASVIVVGTDIRTETGLDGTFLIDGVPLGRALVRVEARGFPSVVEEVEVTPEGVPLPVFLQSTVAALEGILVFGSRSHAGQARVAKSAADLVANKVPSIRPLLARATESRTAPTTFTMRGRNNLGAGAGEPLIVVDGMRLTGGIGSALRALQQIPAADVESVQVLKGTSSAWVYGAPDGAIIIETVSRTAGR